VVEPEDLWSVLQDALDESAVPENKFNIQEVMDSWIWQKGYPLVTVTRDQQTGKMTFTQEPYRAFDKHRENTRETDSCKRWWIPINFATRSNPDFTSTLATAWLSPEVDEFVMTDSIAPQDWIIANIQHAGRAGLKEIVYVRSLADSLSRHRSILSITGFYRVNYDVTNWLKIADYLNSDDYSKIHVLNRAQVINDAMHFMFSSKLDPEIFMSITSYLRRETDCIPWSPLFMILEEMLRCFDYNDGGTLLKVSSLGAHYELRVLHTLKSVDQGLL